MILCDQISTKKEIRVIINVAGRVANVIPQNLPGQKPLVLVTHDESTFSANDGKPQLWMENLNSHCDQRLGGKV